MEQRDRWFIAGLLILGAALTIKPDNHTWQFLDFFAMFVLAMIWAAKG